MPTSAGPFVQTEQQTLGDPGTYIGKTIIPRPPAPRRQPMDALTVPRRQAFLVTLWYPIICPYLVIRHRVARGREPRVLWTPIKVEVSSRHGRQRHYGNLLHLFCVPIDSTNCGYEQRLPRSKCESRIFGLWLEPHSDLTCMLSIVIGRITFTLYTWLMVPLVADGMTITIGGECVKTKKFGKMLKR